MTERWDSNFEMAVGRNAAGAVRVDAQLQGTLALVQARAMGRSYRVGSTAVAALRSASCSVEPGDRIAIVGRSGSGKSTLLQLLAGLDEPTSGTLTWPALGDRDQLRPQQVAMVFQAATLLDPLTVLENVELPLLIARSDSTVARRAAEQALEIVGLEGLADKLPEELSGGQAQRVAVARALAVRPKLLLADEPTGQLDQATAQRLLDVVLNALEQTRAALVIATHDSSVARRMTDVWTIQHGVLSGARE